MSPIGNSICAVNIYITDHVYTITPTLWPTVENCMISALGCVQEISQLISPPVNNVTKFLEQHMSSDLTCIQRAVGCSLDDAAVLLQLLVNRLLTSADIGQLVP